MDRDPVGGCLVFPCEQNMTIFSVCSCLASPSPPLTPAQSSLGPGGRCNQSGVIFLRKVIEEKRVMGRVSAGTETAKPQESLQSI